MQTLRFITCGSVDDGKSTLIGRLLYETKKVFEDQLTALAAESRVHGTQGERLDFALLVDGLAAEREQGITIDVAYRYFATEKRRFIVADTPGHEQYTRNMATAASTADVAILLIDARKGVLVQTRRHSRIARLLGVRHIVLAVNKMDLVDWSEARFKDIEADYAHFAEPLGIQSITAIPIAAIDGTNVVERGHAEAPWYKGPSLIEWLETIPVGDDQLAKPFAMPVQWVNRPDPDFRGFSGRLASGSVSIGDAVRVAPSGVGSHVRRIINGMADTNKAVAGQSVTLVLDDEIDVSRGDVFVGETQTITPADQFEANLVWMSDKPLQAGRAYIIQLHRISAGVTVSRIKYRVAINTEEHLAAETLALNEIGVVNLSLDRLVPYAAYDENRMLGGFILVNRITNETLAAGTIRHALKRNDNLHWQALDITKKARAALKHQKAFCLWLTGLSGSGKSTIANLVEKNLHAEGRHTYILDGDNIRQGLNRDLGFKESDRVENIRRVAEVAKLMVDAGLIVIVSFISPYREERDMARRLFEEGEFVEVFVDTPLDLCEQRDVKGLYAKVRKGDLKNFTGIDSPYEPPHAPDIHIKTESMTAINSAEYIVEQLLPKA